MSTGSRKALSWVIRSVIGISLCLVVMVPVLATPVRLFLTTRVDFLTNHVMHINRVSTTYVTLLYEFLAREGRDATALLGPLPDERIHPYTRVDDWRAMLETVAGEVGRNALGLRVARGITPRHFGIVGYLCLASANLGEALAHTERYASLVYDVNPLHLSSEGDRLVIRWGTENGRPGQLVDETGVAAMVQLARDFTGRDWPVSKVCFVNATPEDVGPYTAFFGGDVLFEQPWTELQLPLGYLQQPLRQPDAALLALLDQQAEAMLAREPVHDSGDPYRSVLIRLLRDGDASLQKLAEAFHVSARTLQRKLAGEGLRYQKLLDDTRRMQAQEYLRDTRLSIADIAGLLGYSEQSAFNRAFRQW